MSVKNAHYKQFGMELGKLLQQSVQDVTTCIVKMSQSHLLRSGGVIHHLGELIVKELNLVPASYGVKKRGADQPPPAVGVAQVAETVDDHANGCGEPSTSSAGASSSPQPTARETPIALKRRRPTFDDVEPSDSSDEDAEDHPVSESDSEPDVINDIEYRLLYCAVIYMFGNTFFDSLIVENSLRTVMGYILLRFSSIYKLI
jgi:hypothetical protein